MGKIRLISLAVLLITGVQVFGADWCDVEINPPAPTSSDPVAITLSGMWGDSCVPNVSSVFVVGNDIYFYVFWDYVPSYCLAVVLPWELTEYVGPLSNGTYSVYGSLDFGPEEWLTNFVVGGGAGEPNEPAEPGIAAHWKLDEPNGTTAYDSAGDNDGSVYEANWTSGWIGGGLDFDGVDDYVSVPDDSSLDISGAITVCAWFKLDVNEGPHCVLGKVVSGAGYSGGGYHLVFSDGTGFSDETLRLVFKKASGIGNTGSGNYGDNTNWDRVVSKKNDWETGVWYFVAATWDGTTNLDSLKMYVDGVLDANHAASQSIIKTNGSPLQLGRSLYSSPMSQFDGVIDNVRIYNKALSAAEIEELYHEATGPIACWKLDETSGTTAYDFIGDNDANVYGATWTSGIIGGALDFDGIDDYVDCGTGSSLEPEIFTISAWIKPEDVGSNQHIAGKLGNEPGDNCGYGYGLKLRYNGKASMEIEPWGCGNGNPLESTTTLEVGRWYLVTGTYDGSTAQIYLNGEMENSGLRTLDSYYHNFSIGAHYSDYHEAFFNHFNGKIDDVRLYDRVLSAEEIEELYKDGTGLIAYWKLDEPNGTTAYDSAGDNDGDVSGATWTSGLIDGALDFNGISDYVGVPDDDSLDVSGAITVSTWVMLDNNADTQTVIAKTNSMGDYDDGGYRLMFSNNTGATDGTYRLYFTKANGSHGTGGGNYGDNTNWDRVVSEKNDWETGVWYFVAATWDGTTNPDSLKMYVDGVLDGEYTANQETILANGYALQIGRTLYSAPRNQFDGRMDDVRIYHRALSSEEIEELYQDGIGLVAHWKLDESSGTTAYDSVGDNDGTVYEANWTSGLIDGGLEFDGVDDYVEVGDEPEFNFGADTDFSVCAWVKPGDNVGTVRIVDKMIAGHNPCTGFEMRTRGGLVMVGMKDDEGDRVEVTAFSGLVRGVWQFVAAVADRDGNLEVYYNGNLEDSNSLALVDNINIGIPLAIGRSMDYDGQYFDGTMDDVRIYDRALSFAEIEELYQDGIGLVAHWKFDEANGTTAYDSAGGNDGYVYDANWTSGIIDGALDFNGAGDYVACGSDSSLDITGSITVGAWIRRPNFETHGTIAGKTNSNSVTAGYGLYSYEQGMEFNFYSAGGWRRTTPRVPISADEWHYVAGTYDGSVAYLYIDGEQRASIVYAGTITAATGYPFNIGFWRSANPTYFDGEIDDVRVYDRALSAEEIRDIYASACMAPTNADYSDWLAFGRPECWCYSRQCRGDTDGYKQLLFWVFSKDLSMFKSAYAKPILPAGGICADIDHDEQLAYRVYSNDLAILKSYYARPDVPSCGNPPDENYNFWINP